VTTAVTWSEVLDVVRMAVARVLEIDPSTVSRATSFAADLHADSLALVEVVEILEEELAPRARAGFRIDDDDIEDMATVGDAVDYVLARL
jgi:acyl carrier protein